MKASELAKALGGTLEGDDVELAACSGLEEARPGDLSFCKDPKHVITPCISSKTWFSPHIPQMKV